MEKNYIEVKTQEELENIPENYTGNVFIEFGKPGKPAIIKNNKNLTIIISNDYVAKIYNSTNIFVEKNASVEAFDSKIEAYNNSHVYAKNCVVNAQHNTTVEGFESVIEAFDSATVESFDSTVFANWQSHILCFGFSKAKRNSINCRIELFHESILI